MIKSRDVNKIETEGQSQTGELKCTLGLKKFNPKLSLTEWAKPDGLAGQPHYLIQTINSTRTE